MSTYYTSKYSGEQIDEAVKKIMDGEMTGDYADRQLSNLDTPQGALANLGAGVRPNLLINPFFEVNQRGQSSYGQGLTVDMWSLGTDGNGKATVANDGIIISGNTGTYCNFEGGIEEVPPGTYTESFLVDDHTKVSQIYANGSGQFNITENLISYTFEVKSELDSVYWGIQKLLSAGDLKIFGAKLEEGDTQTLAYQDDTGAWQLLPQPESDYATQMLKCQRYYQIYSTADARPSKAADCRPVMRTDPAQGTIVVGDTTYYYNTAEL